MKLSLVPSLFARTAEQHPPNSDDPAALLFSQYDFLRRTCARAVGLLPGALEQNYQGDLDATRELEAEELFSAVLDRLREHDFRVLRDFTGRASLTTYLTTIVANLARDRHRSAQGRDRSRERAEQLGELGLAVHGLVIDKGFTPESAHDWLTRDEGMTVTPDQVRDLATRIRGRGQTMPLPDDLQVVIDADQDDDPETVSYTLADTRPRQDEQIMAVQRSGLRQQVLADVIDSLTGEERLVLRMRFPEGEEEEPRSFAEIGRLLGITEKAADHRLRRILAGFRERLLRQGLGLDDLLDSG